ncbi:hypothetical protein C0989_003636 [Termitomyces sp. Mn162]|nr:hypothetical protein C0989_003636 [Termitomyces sp. Mn162]
MSERWDPLEPSIAPEFFVSVEIYLSTAAASALPKPIPRSKRREKFEISASAQPEERKVKVEKSSWLALSKGLPEGPWRPATCKLSGEGERCLLNIYLDKNRLYQTVYVHLLNQTDLRQADVSLFDKKDCLSIYCIGGQRWTSTHTAEPIYLHFSSNETCNTWLVLLRSYAVPEIYGRLPFPNDGGSYRMWRQLELTVVQGRGLGIVKLSENRLSGDVGESDDFTVSCHVLLNSILCGRTSEKKAMGSPDWLENFTFSDLPPFDSLVLLIRRDKKMTKTTTLGSVLIPLVHFRRGEVVEGWFPILHSGSTASDFQVGELRLKILVNELSFFMERMNCSFVQLNTEKSFSLKRLMRRSFSSRNFLDLIDDFENKLKMKNISPCLMSLAIDQNVVVSHVQEFAAREVNAASPGELGNRA